MAYSVLDAAKARFPNYDQPAFNVLERARLDDSLRALLPVSSREEWPAHANYAQGAKDLRAIHQAMLGNSAGVTQALTALVGGRVPEGERAGLAQQAHDIARHVVDHLHTHHRIEDERLFPHFAKANPKIERAIHLLEADHRVLNAAASVFDAALRAYPAVDARPAAYDRAAEAAAQLDRVMRRHIADEEDIVIPAYLGLR
jgi:hypothetical protein